MGAVLWQITDKAITDLVVYISIDADRSTADNWVKDLRAAGFHVHAITETDPAHRRHLLHVPPQLAAQVCTVTANPSSYVMSGYVPARAIAKMLAEHPQIHGLSIPDSPEVSAAVNRHEEVRADVWAYWDDGRQQLYAYDSSAGRP